MIKKFNLWNHLKKNTHTQERMFFCHTREVWFVRLGENIGFEENGKGKEFLRPVIILKKFNNEVVLSLPLTSQKKSGKYYFKVENINNRENWVILSQLKLLDTKRLKYKIGIINQNTFKEIKKIISDMILSDNDF